MIDFHGRDKFFRRGVRGRDVNLFRLERQRDSVRARTSKVNRRENARTSCEKKTRDVFLDLPGPQLARSYVFLPFCCWRRSISFTNHGLTLPLHLD